MTDSNYPGITAYNWRDTGIDTITWVDVETTGLNAVSDLLLEIAVIVTDKDLNILDEEGFHEVVFQSKDYARALAVPFVQEMHDKTGLWDRLEHGKPRADVDVELRRYLEQFHDPRTSPVGGNSVRLDMNFMDVHLPLTAAHLSYRMIDVSTVRQLEEFWYGTEPLEKKSDHTAMTDIRESIRELKHYRAAARRRTDAAFTDGAHRG